jgi:arylsulfatase A-like enzyme
MLVPETDRIVFHLINDLADRRMLDDTLVLIMGEFGRTPWLNEARGRDHYPKAWSMAMAGCGLKPGVVYGSTDENGVEVSDRPLDQRRLFATIYRALGLDPHVTYDLPDFPTFNRVEKDAAPVAELLA